MDRDTLPSFADPVMLPAIQKFLSSPGDVGLDRHRARTLGSDPPGDVFHLIHVRDVVHRDIGPFLCEHFGDASADAAGASSDDSYLITPVRHLRLNHAAAGSYVERAAGGLASRRGPAASLLRHFSHSVAHHLRREGVLVFLAALQRQDEALACFDKLIAMKADFVEAHFHQGNVLLGLGRFPEAIVSFDNAIVLDPHHVTALTNKGHALHELGRFAEAITCYDRILTVNPAHVPALINRGAAFKDLRQVEKAIAESANQRAETEKALAEAARARSEKERGPRVESCHE